MSRISKLSFLPNIDKEEDMVASISSEEEDEEEYDANYRHLGIGYEKNVTFVTQPLERLNTMMNSACKATYKHYKTNRRNLGLIEESPLVYRKDQTNFTFFKGNLGDDDSDQRMSLLINS